MPHQYRDIVLGRDRCHIIKINSNNYRHHQQQHHHHLHHRPQSLLIFIFDNIIITHNSQCNKELFKMKCCTDNRTIKNTKEQAIKLKKGIRYTGFVLTV